MGCTTTGLVAILVMLAALIFSSVSFLAPNWSMSESPADTLTNIKFSTGVWGYCVNAEYNTGTNLSSTFVDTCFCFYTGGKIALNETKSFRQSEPSVCEAVWSPAEDDLSPFVDVTGVDKAAFRTFLVLACGSVGKSSFAFSVLSVVFGLIGLLCTIFFVACCQDRSCFVGFIKAITIGAALSSLVSFSCWLSQSSPLNRVGIHPGSCFVIQVLACATYLGAFVAMNHHASSESLEAKTIE